MWQTAIHKYKLLIEFIFLVGFLYVTRVGLFLHWTGASFPLSLKWEADLGNSTYERPAYQQGVVFFPANSLITSYWYGIDATTGQIIWIRQTPQNSYLRCLNLNYLVVSGDNSLLALKTTDGGVAWKGKRAYTATCSDEVIFFSAYYRDTFYAVSIPNGQKLWTFMPDEMKNWSELKGYTGLGTLVYNPERDELIASGAVIISPTSGKIIRVLHPTLVIDISSKELVNRGQIFFGGTVLDVQTGQMLHKEERYISDLPPTVTADTVYLASGSKVVALNRDTYEVKWVYSPQGLLPLYTTSSIAVLNGIGYVIYSDATLYAIDLNTGQEQGHWQPGIFDLLFWPCIIPQSPNCRSQTGVGMTTSDDSLFASFSNGKLYAFGR